MRWYGFLFVVAVLCVIGLLRVGLVLADNGPHVKGFLSETGACGMCHRAHTAPGPSLIKTSTQHGLCFSCHDGSGANTDVPDGIYLDGTPENEGLKGGGFIAALMDPGLTGTPESAVVTSSHVVDGTPATAWAGDPISGAPYYGNSITLVCGNCHNPHGNEQYRILRPTPNEGYGAASENASHPNRLDSQHGCKRTVLHVKP